MDGIISVAIVSITFIYANSMGKTIHRGNLILIRIMAWVVVASLMYFFGSSLDKLLIYLGFPGLNHIFPDLMSPTERLSFVLTLFASLSISLSLYLLTSKYLLTLMEKTKNKALKDASALAPVYSIRACGSYFGSLTSGTLETSPPPMS